MAKDVRRSSRNSGRATVGRLAKISEIRRTEIIDAAASAIAERGIQNLSLSEIESRTGMSRGQLTYYFPEKEQILLAVFDRTVARMREDVAGRKRPQACEYMAEILAMIMFRPLTPEFVGLQYTFLAQTGHRQDYRQRLAKLYSHWRSKLIDAINGREHRRFAANANTRASLFQAVAHGLAVQLVADPKAFDRHEMMEFCQHVFALVANGEQKQKKAKPQGRRHE